MLIKKIGVFFLVISVFLSFGNFTLTGAVVGASEYSFVNLTAFIFFICGVVVVLVSGALETRVESADMTSQAIKKVLDRNLPENKSVIVDACYWINHAKEGDGLYNSFKGSTVPYEVLAELSGRNKRRPSLISKMVESGSVRPDEGYKVYIEKSKDILNQGSKAYTAGILIGVLEGGDPAPLKGDPDYWIYQNAITDINRKLEKNNEEVTPENQAREARWIYGISEGDAAVLASAIHDAKRGKVAVVLSDDGDLKEAVKYLKNTEGIKNILYFNSKGQAA